MLIFAHRGASQAAPENTLLAVQKALEMGADAVEIDVHSIEDQLVVIHDRWLTRTTKGQGRLQDVSFEYLRQVDAGNGLQVPTLWEVMQCVAGQCILNIELKGIARLSTVIDMVDKAIAELGFTAEQFLLSSFDHPLLHELKQLRPQWRIGALTACCPLHYAKFAEDLQAYSVHTDVSFTTQALIDDAHARKLKVYVYTVDETVDMDELQAMEVDGIFTNVPDRALQHLGRSRLT